MSSAVQPWLEGLSDAWELPTDVQAAHSVSSASHDAISLRGNNTRAPGRSLSGLPSSLRGANISSQSSAQIKRSPLAPLTNTNTFRRNNGTAKSAGKSTSSVGSDGSMLPYGTVQQRSKSASPAKKMETLEWKRRLVNGQVGYGDQTDLFGPSPLENIFARSRGPESDASVPKNRLRWLQKSDAPMPSSPPPWPSSFTADPGQEQDDLLEHENKEDDIEAISDVQEEEPSFRSNPFDLATSGESHTAATDEQPRSSSPASQAIGTGEGVINRTISGQTELEQEDFSPVFISKHTTVNGQVGYAALDSRLVKQFHDMRVDLRHASQEEPCDHQSLEQRGRPEHLTFTDGPEDTTTPAQPDLSLSENLPTGTPPVVSLGRYVELQRGGYSMNGSFKQRLLSPSPSKVETSVQQSASKLLSSTLLDVQLPQIVPPPHVPSTPRQRRMPDPPVQKSSGSPLKLFGPHDTFTNNNLLRRMSQLDAGNHAGSEDVEKVKYDVTAPGARKVSKTFVRDSFGSGELDSHLFEAEITVTSASESSKNDSNQSPGSEIAVPGCKTPLGFRVERSPEVTETLKLKRKILTQSPIERVGSTSKSTHQSSMHSPVYHREISEVEPYHEKSGQIRSGDGSKRPRTSPVKNPTPKRRRTLHASELEICANQADRSCHQEQLQEASSSWKREEARTGQNQNIADADILDQRKMLRPRNPTPSQRRRQQIEAELRKATDRFAAQEPEKLEAVMEQIESSFASSDSTPPTLQQQAEAVATEVANFTMKVQRPSGEHGERKRSVTTQDFLNEAIMVMNLIRAKARPQSGLGSVEESDAEGLGQSLHPDGSDARDEVDLLPLSRPPSREHGHSGWRTALKPPTDARVVSHLRKFQEKDDTEFIAESTVSLHVDDDDGFEDNVIAVDEECNIRITGPAVREWRSRAQSDSDSRPVSQRSQESALQTQSSHQSGGTSTGRTMATSSTRKSDNVGMLAPDAVAHLIGEQVGGMAFDKETQRWLRVRSPEKVNDSRPVGSPTHLEPPSELTSDDDPFREISDLPVDEVKEFKRVNSSGRFRNATPESGESRTAPVAAQIEGDNRVESTETVGPRPVTRDGVPYHHKHSSSVPSRCSGLASSQQQEEQVETRATSWSDEHLVRSSALDTEKQQPLAYAAAQATLALRSKDAVPVQVNHGHAVVAQPSEQILEHAAAPRVGRPSSIAQPAVLDGLREDTCVNGAESDVEEIESPKLRQTPKRACFPLPPGHRGTDRDASLRRRTLRSKFNAGDAHEQSEISFVAALPGERLVSVSLSVSRPLTVRQPHQSVSQLPSSPCKPDTSWILSDLPDFTIHEIDAQSTSERALATRVAQHAVTESDHRYALSVKDLVKTLTDVQQDELFWEDLEHLDLHDRSLLSLYGLDYFCNRVQDMDVSSNALAHLEGAPSTLRRLLARSNHISNLTCWNHLANLQYLDVSGNQLESLRGLAHLVHLRELCADDNQITDLDGVLGLDGLLKLRLRRNKLHSVDFEKSTLFRLLELDFLGNGISRTSGLDSLQSLSALILDKNPLQSLQEKLVPLPALLSISMQGCGLKSLDVSSFPGLRKLLLDDNSLAKIENLETLEHLELLSVRRQSLPEGSSLSVFDEPMEARIVRLSGNVIPTLQLHHNFLNLKELELSSVGLQELPEDFGLRMPNLRLLNLNFNALHDPRPLLNIQNLQTLEVCGNRLNRLRKSVATLAKMPSLKSLDLRDNPVTQGFYPPSVTAQSNLVRRSADMGATDEDEHAQTLERARHSLPPLDADLDMLHQGRLGEETKLRRLVYQLLLTHSCPSLLNVDGLSMAKGHIQDRVWGRLVELGIVRKTQHGDHEA